MLFTQGAHITKGVIEWGPANVALFEQKEKEWGGGNHEKWEKGIH